MSRRAPNSRSSLARLLVPCAVVIACNSATDRPSADTDSPGSTTTEPSTTAEDDAPPLDSTDGGPGTVGPDTDTDPSGMTEGPTDGSGSTDDGPMGCTSDDECTEADAPFCVQMICSPCSAEDDPDAACAEKFPETPACSASTCVQCAAGATEACVGTTPICDVEANTCVGCTAHDQCPDSACHIPYPDRARATDLDGACFDPTTVVHVDGDGGQAFTTIQAAVNAFGVGEEGVIIVHDATADYNEVVSVTSNRVLAIMAASGETPQWIQSGTGSQLSLTDTSTTVFLDRMRLESNNDEGVPAIGLSNGRVHIQRSAIVENDGGGIAAANGALVYLENSFVGGSINNVAAISIDGSDATILYSTVLAGFGASARSLACAAPGDVVVRNSILLGETTSDSVSCAGETFANNASDQNLGAGNTTVAEFDGNTANWFTNYAGGNFSLTSDGAGSGEVVFCGVANWQDGDPLADINGDARPGTDGSPDCAGADVPTP